MIYLGVAFLIIYIAHVYLTHKENKEHLSLIRENHTETHFYFKGMLRNHSIGMTKDAAQVLLEDEKDLINLAKRITTKELMITEKNLQKKLDELAILEAKNVKHKELKTTDTDTAPSGRNFYE